MVGPHWGRPPSGRLHMNMHANWMDPCQTCSLQRRHAQLRDLRDVAILDLDVPRGHHPHLLLVDLPKLDRLVVGGEEEERASATATPTNSIDFDADAASSDADYKMGAGRVPLCGLNKTEFTKNCSKVIPK